MTGRLRAPASLLAVLGGTGLLWLSGRLVPIAAPWSPARWTSWFTAAGPVDATFAVVRWAGLAAGAYLSVLLVGATAASALRRPRLHLLTVRCTPTALRPIVAAAAGVTLWAATVPGGFTAGALGQAPGEPPARPPALRPFSPRHPRQEPRPGSARAATGRAAPAPDPPILEPAPPVTSPAATRRRPPSGRGRLSFPLPYPPRPSVVPAAPDPQVWVVRPGESFWSIAAAVVRIHQPGADDVAVGAYWLRFVHANRSRLPIPGDPDLLYAGDRLVLPPLP